MALFSQRKIGQSDGWTWYPFNRRTTIDGKFIIQDAHQRVLDLFDRLKDAVDRDIITCIKYPVAPDAPDKSVLIVFCKDKNRAMAERELQRQDVPKYFWSDDARDINQMERDRGYKLSQELNNSVEGQVILFESLLRLWCHLLRKKGRFWTKFHRESRDDAHILEGTFYKATGLFSSVACMKMRYQFYTRHDTKNSERQARIVISLIPPIDEELKHELKDLTSASRIELNNLAEKSNITVES